MIARRGVLAGLAGIAAVPAVAQVVLNPKGPGDQTERLQAAISNGGAVELGAGTFQVTSLRIDQPVSIRGVAGQTVLESDADELLSIASTSVSIEGVLFKTGSPKTKLVVARSCENLSIDHCSFIGGDSGLVLERSGGTISSNNFAAQESSGMYSIDAIGLQISGNTVTDIGNNGILVWRSEIGEDGTIVTGNRVSKIADRAGGTGQNGNGINVYRAGNVVITNNRLTDCAFSGIRNNSGSNSQIVGNSISRAGEVALYVEFAFEGSVVANNLIEDIALGISITNFDQGGRLVSCNGNVIRKVNGGNAGGNRTEAVGIHAEADTVISNNVIEHATRGISMGWGGMCRNLSATGNLIRDCKVGISPSVTEGAGEMNISSNVLDGCETGIQGFDHAEAMTDDLAGTNAEIPKHLHITDNIKL